MTSKGVKIMCGRFRVEISPKDIIGFYRLIEEIDKRYKAHQDYFSSEPRDYYPGTEAVVLTQQGIEKQTWGFPLDKKLVFNSRSESLEEKRMFQPLVDQNRCVIPATTFYEWNNKRKFTISTSRAPYFFMAGLCNTYRDETGKPLTRFVILTTAADQEMEKIHPRMPVILDAATLKAYLDPSVAYRSIRQQIVPWNQGLLIDLAMGEQLSLLD